MTENHGSETRVVHVNSKEWHDTPEDQQVYIGRAVPRRGFPKSKYANPYKISKVFTREVVITMHEDLVRRYARVHPERFREVLAKMRGKVLGCWCKAVKPGDKDQPCHGDTWARLADMSSEELDQWMAIERA